MKYKIIVDKQPMTTPSDEKKEYIIDIEELRVKGDVYDSLNIEKDRTYVTRRLSLSEYGVLSILEEPKQEELTDINIKLFEGDNYIYLLDMTGNKFYAEYIVKNDFTDIYVTKNEMNSSINQTAQNIELSVNQKLEGYSNTEEMNATIKVTADGINSEVSKKVGKNEIISNINQSAEAVQINANKISLEGKKIDLTGDNVTISSNNFNVDKNGNMTCNNGTFKGGTIEITGGTIKNPKFRIKSNTDSEKETLVTPTDINIGKGNKYIRLTTDGIPMFSIKGENTSLSFLDNLNRLDIDVDNVYFVQGIVHANNFLYDSMGNKKKNIKKFKENALEILMGIDIYEYNFKHEDNKEKKHIGFIIDDKYKYTKKVTGKDNTGVDNYAYTSLCVKAIQELSQKIQEQQKRIENLENKLKEVANG